MDEIRVSRLARVSDAPSAVTMSATLELALSPNPARGAADAAFVLPRAGHARVSVFDLSGRRVAVLHDGELSAGAHRVRWEGVSAGRSVAPGAYVVRLEANGASVQRTWVRLR
jgi:hypothetical protein